MPLPNYHSCRLEDPDQYDRFTQSKCAQKHDNKCIDVNYGWKTKDGKEVSEIESLRYETSVWTEADARSHCKSRDGSFTASGEEDKASAADESYLCECIECGYEMESDEHCRDIKCPECGGQMRRAERPGPGQKDLMERKFMAVKMNPKGRSNANSLIDAGKVDKTISWSWSAEDGNKILGDPPDWSAYTKWFMGTENDADSETKAYYKYPFGKNGKVYRSALIAIRQRAAQQDETDIYDVVGAMINRIDGNKAMSWFEIKAQKDGELSEIWIYDEIGYWGITAKADLVIYPDFG